MSRINVTAHTVADTAPTVADTAHTVSDVTQAVLNILDACGIEYVSLKHSPIMTMEEGALIADQLGSTSCKSLLLCTKKKKDYFMLLLPAMKKYSAKCVASQLNTSHMSFASEEDMERLVGCRPGAVSVLGLAHDKDNRVQVVIHKDLLEADEIGCHPCVNSHSLKIHMSDLLEKFLPAIRHENYLVIDDIESADG